MLIIKILLCLALYPSWSSTITVEKRAKLDDELEKALKDVSNDRNPGEDVFKDLGPKLHRIMEAAGAVSKAVFDELPVKVDEKKVEENGTRSYTPGMLDEAVKALKTARALSDDFLKDLNELGPKLADLIKTVVPIYGLSFNEPESDEYKAFLDFKTRSDVIWEDINTRPYEFDDDEMESWARAMIVSNKEFLFDEQSGLLHFRESCRTGDTGPISILKHLKSHLITECGDSLTTKEVEDMAKHRRHCKEILRRAFRQFKVEKESTIPDPSEYLPEFMYSYKHLDKSFAMENMKIFGNSYSSYKDAINQWFREIPRLSTASNVQQFEDECFLRAPTIESTFNYTRIGLFARKLHTNLVGIALHSAICSNLMFSGRSSMDIYADEIAAMTTNITTSTSKWLNESLAAAWPTIHNQIFQDQIETIVKQPGHFDRNMMTKAAEITNSILDKTGIPGYTYDLLIVKAPEKNFQFHFESLSNNFHFDKGDFGFNTILARRPFNYSNRMDQLNLQDKMRRLRIQIKSEMKNLYDAAHVTEIAEGLKIKLGSFLSENGFQGFAIARKWEKDIFKSCSAIDDVQYSYDAFSTIYNFTYQNPGNMLQHCETFNFYFFLEDTNDSLADLTRPKLDNSMKPAILISDVAVKNINPKTKSNEYETTTVAEKSQTYQILKDAVKALKAASTSSGDPIVDLREMGPKLANLAKAAVPFGAIVVKKLNPEPGSEEYKVLMEFKNRSAGIWNNISAITRTRIGSLGGQKLTKEYDKKVSSLINEMKYRTDIFLNPEIRKREDFLDEFRRDFSGFRMDPGDALEIVTEFMDIYGRASKKFTFEWFEEEVFKKHFSNYDGAIDTYLGGLLRYGLSNEEKLWSIEDNCLLRALTIEKTFDYTRIGLFVRKLQNELIDFAFSSATYANICYKKFAVEDQTKKIADMITNITSSSSKWLNESLTSAWPAIHNQIFQDQIRNVLTKQPGYFDREELEKTAELTNSILNKTGIPGYTYDMLIVRAPEKNFQFHIEDLSDNYHFDEGDFGFHTVLVRRPLNYWDHRFYLNLQDKMRRLRIQIESEMGHLYDAKDVTEIAEGLKNKLGSFISKNGFRGIAIARKWEKNIFKSCSAIDDVHYSKDSFSTIYNFTYQNSGDKFQHCETFNFYFFF